MRRSVEFVLWAALSFGIWVVTLSSINAQDVEIAAAASVLTGLAGVGGRILVGRGLRVGPGWLGWLAVLPVAVPTDTVRILAFAARSAWHGGRLTGTSRLVQLPLDESESRASGRRAVFTLLQAVTPGSYTVDSDPTSRTILVHSLVATRPRWASPDPTRSH